MKEAFQCPNCKIPLPQTDQSFHCSRCGWDSEIAAKSLSRASYIYGGTVFIVFIVTFWAEMSVAPRVAAAVLATGVAITIGGWEWLNRLWIASKVSKSADPREWDLWLRLPPPRVVRIKEEAKASTARVLAMITIFVGFTSLTALLLVELHAYSPTRLRFLILSGIVPCCAGASAFLFLLALSFKKSRRLVTYGEVAIGTVVGLRTSQLGVHTVTYEFQDNSGRIVSASCTDIGGSVGQGMSIPVFFNPANPTKDQVALCASSYEVCSRPSRSSG